MWSKSSSPDKAPDQPSVLSVSDGESTKSPPAMTSVPARGPQAKIGKTIVVRGELTGSEDLTIEGRVEGKISLKEHHLTVGETGNISAEVITKIMTVIGRMEGNLIAKEKVEITESGSMTGDIIAPRIVVADGAKLKGSVDMSSESGSTSRNSPTATSSPKRKEGVPSQKSHVSEAAAQKES